MSGYAIFLIFLYFVYIDKYIFKNMFSENAAKEMQKRMTEMDRREFCAKYYIQI